MNKMTWYASPPDGPPGNCTECKAPAQVLHASRIMRITRTNGKVSNVEEIGTGRACADCAETE